MEELADDEPVLDPATELREKMCAHGVLLRECADPACREMWLAVWREFSRGFEGFQPVLPRFPRPPAPALEPAEAVAERKRAKRTEEEEAGEAGGSAVKKRSYRSAAERQREAEAAGPPGANRAAREVREHCGPYCFVAWCNDQQKGAKHGITAAKGTQQRAAQEAAAEIRQQEKVNSEGIVGRASAYFEVVGKCHCLTSSWCDVSMVRNKYVPWTRFPTADGTGKMFSAAFTVWKNPSACRAEDDFSRHILSTLTPDMNGALRLQYPATWTVNVGGPVPGKWPKVWYAVDRLHAWATGAIQLSDAEREMYTMAYFCDEALKEPPKSSLQSIRTAYAAAGLLAAESVEDWVRYRYCREHDWPDLVLDESQQDSLMHMLLQRKREAVLLFEKLEWLKGLEVYEERAHMPVNAIRPMTGEALATFKHTDAALRATREAEQALAAAAWPARKVVADAAAAAGRARRRKEKEAQKEAVAGMLALKRSGEHVCVLLECLHRLVLDDWGGEVDE